MLNKRKKTSGTSIHIRYIFTQARNGASEANRIRAESLVGERRVFCPNPLEHKTFRRKYGLAQLFQPSIAIPLIGATLLSYSPFVQAGCRILLKANL